MQGSSDIDEVKQRASIIDVVSRYVALQRRGSAWKGLCPFHNEKTPSFTVNPDTGRWHCFGTCGEGGDVIKFVMKIENLSFREALERLANQYNITLTQQAARDPAQAQAASSKRDRAYRACELAATFYQETLANSAHAREYLVNRGFGHEILSAFKVGYAGVDWEALPRFLTRNGVSMEDALDAGVVMANDYGGAYRDKFGERIIFPIVNVEDRVVGFGGRLMETIENRPKYLNSAETPIFVKSRQLYGLWRARKPIAAANQAIVVEGYLDVIACHQAGIENVIATLGTALTEDHASVLSRHAKRVILAFDADAAGIKAAQKASAIFAPRDMDVRMLALPDGEDPDSMLKSGKEIELNRAIQGAVPVTEFFFRKLVKQGTSGMSESDREALLRNEALPILRAVTGITERERYIRLCAPLHPHFSAGSAYAEEQIRQELDGRAQPRPQSQFNDRAGWNGKKFQGDRGDRRSGGWNGNRKLDAPQAQVPPPPNIREACEQIIRAIVSGGDDLKVLALTELQPDDLVPALQTIYSDIRGGEDAVSVLERYAAEDREIAHLLARITVEGTAESSPITEEGLRAYVVYIKAHRQDAVENQLRVWMEAGDLTAVAEYQALKKRSKRSPWSVHAAMQPRNPDSA